MRVGVIALQGDVSEHIGAFKRAFKENKIRGEVISIRGPDCVPTCDLLSIPGGESTTIGRLLKREGIDEEIREFVQRGGKVFATCAGLILLSKHTGDSRVYSLNLMDTWVVRNAFGRQSESFQIPIRVRGVNGSVDAVFIRAPAITGVGKDVEVLARYGRYIVAVRQGNIYAFSFHPELTENSSGIYKMVLG